MDEKTLRERNTRAFLRGIGERVNFDADVKGLSEVDKKLDDAAVLKFVGEAGECARVDIMQLEAALEARALGRAGIARAFSALDRLVDDGRVFEKKGKAEIFNRYSLTPSGKKDYLGVKAKK